MKQQTSIIHRWKTSSPSVQLRWQTIGLLAFGILSQVLCAQIASSGDLDVYGRHILVCLILGAAVYGIVRLLMHRHWILKTLMAILGIVMVGSNLILLLSLGLAASLEDLRRVEYVDLNDVLHADTAQVSLELLGKCHLVGQGDPFFEYPDPEEVDTSSFENRTLYNLSLRERNRAEAVFGRFRQTAVLPVLNYSYGLWVLALYILLGWKWSIAAGKTIPAISSRWHRGLFIGIGLVPAFMILAPVLSAFGLLPLLLPHPFSTNEAVNLLFIVPQLAAMLAMADSQCANR